MLLIRGDCYPSGVDRRGLGIGPAMGVYAGGWNLLHNSAGVCVDSAADSCSTKAGAGLSEHYASRSASFPVVADRARGVPGPAVEQDRAVGKMEAGCRFGAGVRVELSGGAMAICKFSDVAGRAQLVFRNGVLCLL